MGVLIHPCPWKWWCEERRWNHSCIHWKLSWYKSLKQKPTQSCIWIHKARSVTLHHFLTTAGLLMDSLGICLLLYWKYIHQIKPVIFMRYRKGGHPNHLEIRSVGWSQPPYIRGPGTLSAWQGTLSVEINSVRQRNQGLFSTVLLQGHLSQQK